MPECVLPQRPDAVILFWHSDVASFDEARMLPAVAADKRRAYVRDLAAVVDTLTGTGARVAVASTGLLGETSWGLFQPRNALFHMKHPLLGAYSAMNQEVALARGATYIPVRDVLLAAVPATQLAYAWCVTLDGRPLPLARSLPHQPLPLAAPSPLLQVRDVGWGTRECGGDGHRGAAVCRRHPWVDRGGGAGGGWGWG